MTELDTALAAARAAGRLLRERWPLEREVRSKGDREIVTEADLASQAAIVARLAGDFPDHAILAEEGGAVHGAGDLCPTWVVDPLDGTTNYAHRLPNWTVSVGLVHGSEARLGVVYDPLRDLAFYAERGRGAYLIGGSGSPPQPLQVSATGRLAAAVVAADWAHDERERQRTLQAFGNVAPACTSVRTFGSACLAMAYLAAGWIDAYFHFALKPWDVAAAAVILAEAGARLTTPEGEPWQVGQPRLAASNGSLHAELLRVMGAAQGRDKEAGPR